MLIIETLNHNSLLSFNCWVSGLDGHLSPVFIASFNHPVYGTVEAFCKPYSETTKGLFNEIAGFLTIKSHQLPQPQHAFLAVLPQQAIPGIKQQAKKEHAWLKERENIICFCASRLDGHSAAIHLNEPASQELSDKLIDEVIAWEDYPASLVNDDILAHTDRHLNNLIRLRAGAYALIDNGRLIDETSENWAVEQLDEVKLYRNRLVEIFPTYVAKKEKISSRCMNASMIFAKINAEIEKEIAHWAKLLLTPDEMEKYLEFHAHRKENISCLMTTRLGLMI